MERRCDRARCPRMGWEDPRRESSPARSPTHLGTRMWNLPHIEAQDSAGGSVGTRPQDCSGQRREALRVELVPSLEGQAQGKDESRRCGEIESRIGSQAPCRHQARYVPPYPIRAAPSIGEDAAHSEDASKAKGTLPMTMTDKDPLPENARLAEMLAAVKAMNESLEAGMRR